MRAPDWRLHLGALRLFLSFFLGMVFGAVLILVETGHEIDRLYTEKAALENEKIALERKMVILEKEQLRLKESRSRVRDVVVHISGAPDGLIEAEVHRKILEESQFLIGKEVQSLQETFESLLKLFSGKKYLVQSHLVEVQLQHLVLGTKVQMYVKITGVSPS